MNESQNIQAILTITSISIVMSPRHCNNGFVSSGVSFTSWKKDVALALVDQPSSDGITIEIPYEVDFLLH